MPREPFRIAKLSVLGLILSSYQYLRSAMVLFPFVFPCLAPFYKTFNTRPQEYFF